MIYQELVLDSSTANHPDTVQIICTMFHGAEGLVAHLRHRNPEGQRTNTMCPLLTRRRSQKSCLSPLLNVVMVLHTCLNVSIKDLIKKAFVRCPENTHILSKDLKFISEISFTQRASNFTSRLQVQHNIQRRQLCAAHPFEH